MVNNKGLLQNKPYLYLISSQVISSLGDWLDLLALLALVGFQWGVTPLEITFVMLCFAGPMILLSPIAGVYADKFDRKRLMIIADLARCIFVVGIVFATSLWQIYVLIFLKSSFAALFIPSKNGKLKEIVPDEQMQQAMAISGMVDNGAKIVGPIISGLVVATLGIYWAFYIDAITFILSAILLIGVPKSVHYKTINHGNVPVANIAFLHQLKEGIKFIYSAPNLLFGLVILSLVLLVLQIADTQIMILFREIPGEPVDLVGYSMAASGLGMFILSAFLSKKSISSTILFQAFGAFVMGAAVASTALMIVLPLHLLWVLFPIAFFAAGAAFGVVMIPFQIDTQKRTPVELSGRVFGAVNSATTLAGIAGMLGGGILSEFLGVVTAYSISGSLLMFVGLVAFLISKLKIKLKVGISLSPKVDKDYKEKRKTKILEAAENVFKRKGFELTTMKDVVEESGMSRGGVYHYFSCTEEMFQMIIENQLLRTFQYIGGFKDSHTSAWDAVSKFLEGMEDDITTSSESIIPVTYEYIITGWRNEKRRKYLEKRYDLAMPEAIALFQMGVDQGEFNPLQSIETISKFFINVTDAITFQTLYLGADKVDAKGQIESLSLYLKNVLQVH
jgi:MFS family permease